MNNCCFYGSLRKPMYNYKRFIEYYGENSIIYKMTTKIPGFELYDISGNYPAAIKSYNDKEMVVDLFSISDSAYDSIQYMEKSAGYYEDTVCINDEFYSIFLFHKEKLQNKQPIELGDWLIYKLSPLNFLK